MEFHALSESLLWSWRYCPFKCTSRLNAVPLPPMSTLPSVTRSTLLARAAFFISSQLDIPSNPNDAAMKYEQSNAMSTKVNRKQSIWDHGWAKQLSQLR